MPARLSAEQSMRIIDRHLLPSAGERTARSSVVTGGLQSADARHGRDVSPAKTLPAFYTSARDGPSPYDSHKGACQCSVDDVWNDQAQFELGLWHSDTGSVHWHKDGPGDARKTTAALSRMAGRSDDEYLVTTESLRAPTIVLVADSRSRSADVPSASAAPPAPENGEQAMRQTPTLTGAARAGPYEELWAVNPQRDRLMLEAEVSSARAAHLVHTLEGNKRKLYSRCVRGHPHGALGIKESPYGPDTGAVYAEHRQQLLRNAQREGRAIRRLDVPKPVDSLFGFCAYRGETRVHGPRTGIAPPDHLLGGYVYRPEPEPPVPYGNASSLFSSA